MAANGTLTVAAAEAASTLYVTATSRVNSAKSGSIVVTIPTVTRITVTPANPQIKRGEGLSFTARVEGTGNPGQGVTWKVDGVSGVAVSLITSNGVLTVSTAETLSQLVITATSAEDPMKSGSTIITIPATPAAVLAATPAPNAAADKVKVTTVPDGWNGAVMTVGQAKARRGDKVTIPVSLVHPGLASLRIQVYYDNDRLRLDNAKRGTEGLKNIAYMSGGIEDYPYIAMWFNASASNDRSTGVLLSLEFTVLPNAPAGDANIGVTINNIDSVSSAGTMIPIAVASGGVTIVN
jgi:hypothetical protein